MQTSLKRKISLLRRLEKIGDWQVENCQGALEDARYEVSSKEDLSRKLQSRLRRGDETIRESMRSHLNVGLVGILGAMSGYQLVLAGESEEAERATKASMEIEGRATEDLMESDALRNAFEHLREKYQLKLDQATQARESAVLDDLWSMRQRRGYADTQR